MQLYRRRTFFGLSAGLVAGLPALAVRAAEPIRLGAIIPLTGPAAEIGTEEQRGIQFSVKKANAKGGIAGRQIEVLFEDNQAKPDLSVLAFNKLVHLNHVPVVLTGYSGPTLAMAPLATRTMTLLVNAGAQTDKLGTASPYLFNTIPQESGEVGVIARFILETLKLKHAAVLYENDAAGIAGRDDFVKDFKAAGGTITGIEPVPFGETNFRPALLKLAGSKPEVLFVTITQGSRQLADQKKQLNITLPVTGTTFLNDPATMADPAAEGWYHTQMHIESPAALTKEFQSIFPGADFAFFSRQYYNATNMVLAAIAKVIAEGKPVTGTNLRAAIFEIRHFPGLLPLDFTSNTATMEIDVNRFEGGKDVLVERAKSG
jgi:branched-chain amino acid transport system substrate-binding protein